MLIWGGIMSKNVTYQQYRDAAYRYNSASEKMRKEKQELEEANESLCKKREELEQIEVKITDNRTQRTDLLERETKIFKQQWEVKKVETDKAVDDEIRKIREVNSGVYCFDCDALISALGRLQKSARTGEYYLTDTIEILQKDKLPVIAFNAGNADSVLGANDCIQLAMLNEIARQRILEKHMKNGVIIPCTHGVMIGTDVVIGADTVILPSTVIRGRTQIGSFCEIGPAVLVEDRVIPDNTTVRP